MSAARKTGVLGGGTMGAGIAHALRLGGDEVVVVDVSAEAAEGARARLRESLGRAAAKPDASASLSELMSGVTTTTDLTAFRGCTLVVEAVPEVPTLKRSALREVEAMLDPDSLLVSNTSSLSIDDLAVGLARPGRFCGMHFFNPVPASALVEVVVGARTTSAVRDAAVRHVERIGKTPIVVADSPGFASSRLGVALALEAIRMLEEGVASAEDIDSAMVLGYRHATGPLRTTDVVGLDVRLAIAEYLEARLGARFAVPDLLREKVDRGELGRKAGRGFFDWP